MPPGRNGAACAGAIDLLGPVVVIGALPGGWGNLGLGGFGVQAATGLWGVGGVPNRVGSTPVTVHLGYWEDGSGATSRGGGTRWDGPSLPCGP